MGHALLYKVRKRPVVLMRLILSGLFSFILAVPVSVSAETEQYILQSGDVISINVVEHPEFSGRNKIRPDGRINYPVIGEIEVASLTCAQLVKIMQGKLASYINNPVVSVSIEAYYANKIYIIGAVGRAGEYEIYEPLDIIKAIAMAGGLQHSKVKSIKIIRADGSLLTLSSAEIWGTGSRRDNRKYLLYPGDTFYVPETFEVPWSMLATVLGIISVTLTIFISINTLSK
jgi:polysaccharide biosynthesis/export protein